MAVSFKCSEISDHNVSWRLFVSVHIKGKVPRGFSFRFLHESVSLKLLSTGPFKAQGAPQVSLTPLENGEKEIILFRHLWVEELTYKYISSFIFTGVSSLILFPSFATSVVDTDGALDLQISLRIFEKIQNAPNISHGKMIHVKSLKQKIS